MYVLNTYVKALVTKFSQAASKPSYAARDPGESPVGVEPDPTASSGWHPGTASPSLVDLFRTALDEESWESFSRGSAIRRAGREGFARNVAVAPGNWGHPSAVPVLSKGLTDPHPLVRAHAAWAIGQVDALTTTQAQETMRGAGLAACLGAAAALKAEQELPRSSPPARATAGHSLLWIRAFGRILNVPTCAVPWRSQTVLGPSYTHVQW